MDLLRQPQGLIAVGPYGPANSTVRARLLHWLDRLEVEDVELILSPGDPFGLAAQVRSRKAAQVPVLLLRNAAKLSRGRLESRLLRSGSAGIYDLDDGLPWDDGRLPGLGAWWKRPWPRSLIADRAARSADRVIAGNELLADWASQRCGDVVVVPTCVEPDDYEGKSTYEVSDPPRIGWLGSPATEGYLVDIAPALAEVHRRTGARLTILGGSVNTDARLAAFSNRAEWSLQAQHQLPATWDVGLMPLRDGVYERAKCAYKLLQYGAAGLPCIGSPVGASSQLLQQVAAPAPNSLDEWVDALTAVLTASPAHRAAMGARATAVVKRDFAYATWQSTWSAAVLGERVNR